MRDVLTRAMQRYLLRLPPAQIDRVLTTKIEPIYRDVREALGLQEVSEDCHCLCETAEGSDYYDRGDIEHDAAGFDYEHQCERFGVERVNAAIRDFLAARLAANPLRRESATA